MKKTVLSLIISAVLISSMCSVASASDDICVRVSIANGTPCVAYEDVIVNDIDNDGALTINDALYCAHEEFYKGGAGEGYGSAMGDYGLNITKLWGVENGGSYGYYVNNISAMGLGDTIKDGDCINAFVYTDTSAYSDAYCWFDKNTVNENEFTLTLSAAGYDADWNPTVSPVIGAYITVDGVKTDAVTDENGTAHVKLSDGKAHMISALSDSMNLVPPVCIAEGKVTAPQTSSPLALLVTAAVMSLGGAYVFKKSNEK